MSIYPPDEFKVDPFDITQKQLGEFLSLVMRGAGEIAIDTFLKKYPSILAFVSFFFHTGHHGAWILSQQDIRTRVGSTKGLKPDYSFSGDSSDGITWWVLELKGADEGIWIEDKNGDFRFSDAANRGVNQLTRYINYCRDAAGPVNELSCQGVKNAIL